MKKLNKEKIFYIFQGESQLKAFMNLKDKFKLYKLPTKYPVVLVGENTDKGDHFLRKMVETDVPVMSHFIQTAENKLDKEKLYYAQTMDIMGYKEGTHYAEIRETKEIKTTFSYHHATSVVMEGQKKLVFADETGRAIKVLNIGEYRLCSSYEFYTVFVSNTLYNNMTNNQGKSKKAKHNSDNKNAKGV